MRLTAVESRSLIFRLEAVDRRNPTLDKEQAEAALREHLEHLGMEPLPVRWVTDAEEGYLAAGSAPESAMWSAADTVERWARLSAAVQAARSAPRGRELAAAESATPEPSAWQVSEEAAFLAARWAAVRSRTSSMMRSGARSALSAVESVVGFAWLLALCGFVLALLLYSAVFLATWVNAAWWRAVWVAWVVWFAWRLIWPFSAVCLAVAMVGELAYLVVRWAAGWSETLSEAWSAAVWSRERWTAIGRSFVAAYEAGLWLFWVLEDEVIAVPRPALRVAGDGRLHCEGGPAMFWSNGGARYWFWRGVRVPREVIEAPQTLTPQQISGERNVEVRRIMIERYGHERYLRESAARLVHEDEWGKLWRVEVRGDEPLVMVEVVDCTAQGEGSYKSYFLRVPPRVRTAREAVGWTYGLSEDEYNPVVET